MHDVGKIATPDEILRKPGPLTPEERAEMQRHTLVRPRDPRQLRERAAPPRGDDRPDSSRALGRQRIPAGLVGEEIPLEGRITAVADVFDALLSDRLYRPALTVAEAVNGP